MCVTGGTRCPQRIGRKTCGPAARYLCPRRLRSSSEKPIHPGKAVKQCSESNRCMELQTARLTLRSFREEDVDAMARLFANPDFMRFSLGVFTKREQTIAFI